MTSCLLQVTRKSILSVTCNTFKTIKFSSCVSLLKSEKVNMPVITAVVAHRRYNTKPSQTLMTSNKPYGSVFKGTTPTPKQVSVNILCSSNKFLQVTHSSGNVINNNRNHLRAQQHPAYNLQPASSFSTSAKTFKTKLSEVFSFNFSLSRLISDHEESRRFYAKGQSGQKKNTVVKINENEMAELIDVESYKSQMDKLSEQMKEDFTKQLSIRNAAGALEQLEVEFEGEKYPLQELAQIGRKSAQLAVLNLSSLPDACVPVLKAIQDSGMNLNPQQDGTTIFVPLPKVTREHRENLARNAKSLFNKYKTAYQTVQNRYVKKVQTQKDGVSQDLAFSVQKQILKLASMYIEDAEKLLAAKQKELLQLEN